MEGHDMKSTFDAIIVGSGQAAPSLAVRLASSGMRTALIEREHFGGTCVNDGCTPTKTMVASARAAFMARRAADYGVRIDGPVSVDMRRVKARKDEIVTQSIASLTRWLKNTENLTTICGHARFVSQRAVGVGDQILEAGRIFINTGGRPVVPDWAGIEQVPYLTNTSMMNLDVLPAHLIVVGGSYIGLEFAQMYRRFGAEVTVLEYADRIIAREDEEVSAEVQAILEREGVRFVLGTRDPRVRRAGPGTDVAVLVRTAADEREVIGSHLLFAVGRRPNTDALDLDQAGIVTDARGFIKVDDQLQTNVPGIWALGDVNGRGAFTHTAYNDYQIVVDNLFGKGSRRVTDRIPAYALFTDPPLGRIGMTETEVRAAGHAALKSVMPMSRVGRARERGETQGFMKVLVDAQTQRILGAALLCIEGDEIVHSLLDVMAADVPYTVIEHAVHIHPTVSELIPTMLENLRPLDSFMRQ
jgi:pyruvate/2-oxoglutarate dehydrogenase complex dihydrolipoamide dehydrogenase (E3) component